MTPTPTWTPRPTRTVGPAATPAASTIFTATDGVFTLKIPANFTSQAGQRQLVGASAERQMNYAAFSAPGTAPQPAILVFYKWPNAGPISNDNAWEQAYAVASLAVKVCPVTLTTGGPIEIGGENAQIHRLRGRLRGAGRVDRVRSRGHELRRFDRSAETVVGRRGALFCGTSSAR